MLDDGLAGRPLDVWCWTKPVGFAVCTSGSMMPQLCRSEKVSDEKKKKLNFVNGIIKKSMVENDY